MRRVLLLGAGGQLGMRLAKELAGHAELESLGRSGLDLSDSDAIRAAVRWSFSGTGPEIVINAAAYTAVDKAETERDLARRVNGVAPGVLAAEMARLGGWLVHYSTDYVFDGSGTWPWVETDATGPLNWYGQTKLEGELAIAASGCKHVILRTSWVYAAEGRNFLHTMLRLGRERKQLSVVDDQIGAPTTAEAITAATLAILPQLQDEVSGLYHLACGGETSWCGFARAIFAAFAERQAAPEVLPIPTTAYPTPATRPANSRLNCGKFAAAFGYRMPEWLAALGDVAAGMLNDR